MSHALRAWTLLALGSCAELAACGSGSPSASGDAGTTGHTSCIVSSMSTTICDFAGNATTSEVDCQNLDPTRCNEANTDYVSSAGGCLFEDQITAYVYPGTCDECNAFLDGGSADLGE